MKAVVVREVSTIVLRPIPKVDTKDVKGKGKAAEVHDTGLEHGRYYGLITLNQITLTSRDRDLAGQLVHVYFELFREILGSGHGKGSHDAEADSQAKLEKVTGKVDKWQGRRKGTKHSKKKNAQNEEEVEQGDSKLIAAVLTGVSRALPFARLDDEKYVCLSRFKRQGSTLDANTCLLAEAFNNTPRCCSRLHIPGPLISPSVPSC